MIGRTFSHYTILEKLGEGGMGEVFLAEDTRLERKIALKFLPVDIARDPKALERFDREAKATASIVHPNIITVHEVGVFDERPYIAMAYVEGRCLSDMLREQKLTVEHAVDIAAQVCEGLAEAHRHGIIHRDVKPANIHIDRFGRVRILDFGLALRTHLAKLTQSHVTVGTVGYMSPEQATGTPVDERSDLFSLGTVLYEMLAGAPPFDGPHPAAVLYAITSQTPRAVRECNPMVSETLAAVVAKSLAKDPAQRFASAGDMLAALRSTESITVRLERAGRRNRRSIMLGSAALLAAVGLVIGPRLFDDDPAAQSLAVLPFANLSGDSSQQYFVDGMTDAIITRLAQISSLRVISPTSVMHYRDARKPLREIAEELDVRMIVEGAVVRDGNQVRISAHLIDAPRDNHVWAEDYKSVDVSQVIELQSRVATSIAQQISVHLTPDERTVIHDWAPAQPGAYDAYLQGRFHFNRRSPADIARALEFFTQAITLDSTFAPGFAGIADCYTARVMWNWDTSRNTFPRARYACEQALRLDPMLAEAHASRAMVQLFYDWDWESAEASFKTAIGLKPGYATAYHWYGLSLMAIGRYDDGIRQMRRAVRLDPFSPIMLVSLSQCYDLNGDYALAAKTVEKAFTVFPEFGYAWLAKSWIEFHQARYADAIECARRAHQLGVDRSEVMMVAGLDKLGLRAQADSVLTRAVGRPNQAFHVQTALYAYSGHPDSAIVKAQRAIDEREWFVVAFRNRWFEPMRDHPAFDELLKTRAPIKGLD
jgi:serine/threonine protein kinase/tetratricopeptide (TPR) repeat protein